MIPRAQLEMTPTLKNAQPSLKQNHGVHPKDVPILGAKWVSPARASPGQGLVRRGSLDIVLFETRLLNIHPPVMHRAAALPGPHQARRAL